MWFVAGDYRNVFGAILREKIVAQRCVGADRSSGTGCSIHREHSGPYLAAISGFHLPSATITGAVPPIHPAAEWIEGRPAA